MIIEENNVEKMNPLNRINENIIYMGDIHVTFFKIKRNFNTRKAKRITVSFIHKNEVFCKRDLNDKENYLHKQLRFKSFASKVKSKKSKKINSNQEFEIEITKVILKKELTCSFV